ncbi:PREDICTED: T-cell surface glycoprotein CD8 alpha chain isoform X1 [Poecilia mexicana]|uniref:T-cell surface glycoprotein CD8 alpha chain isoform X1 n=1 Tax=Poecilia mexicana TaxID=48701 RepID=UPI00072EA968|nr:PREDICTED: T-cell surface glycoprotein CD8 alpha chain isoform X1 [Poecilia mexicana]
MDQKVIQVLLLLFLCPQIHSAVKTVREGESEKVKCTPPPRGTIVFWFRVVEDQDMEFIGSFAPGGSLKIAGDNYGNDKNLVVVKQSYDFVLTVKSFNKKSDSGMYTCAALVSGNTLSFGQVTQLQGQIRTTTKPPVIQVSTTRQTTTTPTSCHCSNKDKSAGPSLFCAPIILGPLAGGCGLLLLLLIITILYCNKIRTRRCPHHYKRKPRMMAPEKQLTDRYV